MKLPAILRRSATPVAQVEKALSPVGEARGYWWPIFESFAGAWQSNVVVDRRTVITNPAVFTCMTLIASDIAKLRVRLVELQGSVWKETANPAFSPVLRKPNPYQNRMQFYENWVLSKLGRGNAYVLKVRDNRNVVVALHVLDPDKVVPLVADDGSVFYDLGTWELAGVVQSVIVPAREMIHDRYNCLFHPLVGLSPIFANGIAATHNSNIIDSSTKFFGGRSRPGGILTAPGKISPDTATRLKEVFDTQFTGENAGKVAVVGDGLKFEAMALTAEESQLIEQLKWGSEIVASTYHVPLYKIGVGPMPTNNNVQALNTEYYSQALQHLIEAIELCLDEGLGLDAAKNGQVLGTEFDISNLLRMDSLTQTQVLKDSVGAGIHAPNEARSVLGLPPVTGGDSPMLQQQNYSLEALAKRDAQEDPFAPATPPAPPPQADDEDEPEDEEETAEEQVAKFMLGFSAAVNEKAVQWTS
jgi:HK97 family phage portal protein